MQFINSIEKLVKGDIIQGRTLAIYNDGLASSCIYMIMIDIASVHWLNKSNRQLTQTISTLLASKNYIYPCQTKSNKKLNHVKPLLQKK
jgi:hypothetical protein